jgi:hypothetical protein
MEDVVERMREDVGFTVASPYGRTDAGGVGFTVSFVSPSPTTSRDVTDRLSSLVVNESLQHREVLGEATRDFLAGQAEAVRGRLIEHGKKVELSRTGKNVPETQVLMIEEAALRDTYKSLLAKLSEVDLNATLERRQIGEQFKVLDRARVPKRPLGPTRAAVTFVGAVIGLCVGLVLAAVSASRRAGQVRPVTP